MYGPDRLIKELTALGHEVEKVTGADGEPYAIVQGYVIELGRFSDRVIDLGLRGTADFPLSVGAAIHVRAEPQLLERGSHGSYNITDSGLGSAWRYWSFNFGWGDGQERSARRLMSQINKVFLNA